MSSNPLAGSRLAKQMLEHVAGLHDGMFVKLVTGPPDTHGSSSRYDELDQVLATMHYAVDGWRFELRAEPAVWTQDLTRTLRVTLTTAHSDDPSQTIHVTHVFAVPSTDLVPHAAAGDATAFWARWLLDRILAVQRHEAMENLWFGDERPFYPEHGGGSDPYRVTYHHASVT